MSTKDKTQDSIVGRALARQKVMALMILWSFDGLLMAFRLMA